MRTGTLFFFILTTAFAFAQDRSTDPQKAAKAKVDRDGVISVSKEAASKPGDNRWTWTVPSKRWGMYDLEVQLAEERPRETAFAVSIAEPAVDPTPEETGGGPFRFYFPKAGDYAITFSWEEGDAVPPIESISLTPAPEGREDLTENDGRVVLHSRDATVLGKMLRYEPNPKKLCLGFWTQPEDRGVWTFEIDEPGTFNVEIDQGCGKGQGGSRGFVATAGTELAFDVEDTGHFQNFRTRSLGKVTFKEAGKHTLTVGAHQKAKVAVMDVREIRLIRQP